ncbi:MAG: tRNA-dihydrouridine synthase family protein [Spirochaetes bacterium]|nr:tRNA-dihydrouridine synthase family protein [Spirochaetota bacterium]
MKKPKLFLAPCADLTTPALRREIRRLSKDVILFSEMISASSLLRGGLRNDYLVKKHDFDDPISFQLIGNDPSVMARAAEKLEANLPYSVDINMGCSAPEIRARGWGSALMADQTLAAKIVRECRKKVKTLSVKCRAGFERSDYDNLFSFVKMLKDEGADFVSLHPRASDIAFKRSADWLLTERLVSENMITVIGNGDIKTADEALMRIGSSPDGIMIGRAAVKMPWIFAEIEAVSNSAAYTVNIEDSALNVLSGIEELLPVEIRESRILKYCVYFCQNLKFGHALFTEIRRNPFSAAEMIRSYFERNPLEKIINRN